MKSHRILLLATILHLICPAYATSQTYATSQQDRQKMQPPMGSRIDSPGNAETLKQLRQAAELGIPGARYGLGMMYLQGNGVPQDYAEAEKWLRQAAEQGHNSAQCIIGAIYGEGKGVAQNYVQAYMWLNLCAATAKGEKRETAAKFRDEIAKRMEPQQIEEAQKLAKEWKPVGMPSPTRVRREPIRVGGNVLESRLIRKVNPIYPEAAKRERISGRVILNVIVDEQGNVSDIRISRGHPLLNEAAVSAVKQWKYSPTLINGEPVPITATVTVFFNLK